MTGNVAVVVVSLFGHTDSEELTGILVLAVLWLWQLPDRVLEA
jgi:hypothetical protein